MKNVSGAKRALKPPKGSHATSRRGIQRARRFGPTLHESPATVNSNRRGIRRLAIRQAELAALARWASRG